MTTLYASTIQTTGRAPTRVPPPTPDPQRDLIARLKARDERAFEELVRSSAGRLLAVARRILGAEEDARDAVQEAFLSAFRSIGAFEGEASPATWLHRIAINACLMKLRSRRRRREQSIDDLLPTFLEDGRMAPAGRGQTAPARFADQAELRGLVRAGVESLPQPYRDVLLLRDLEQLDTRETALLLGLTEAAVKARLHRARQALRTILGPHLQPAPL